MDEERGDEVKVLTYEKRMLTKELEHERALRQKAIEDFQAASKVSDVSLRQLAQIKEDIKADKLWPSNVENIGYSP